MHNILVKPVLFLAMVSLILGGATCPAKNPSGDFSLTILHTNDSHGRWEPFSVGLEPTEGGIARRKAAVDKFRKIKENVLLVDPGDIGQGTPFHQYYKGAAAKELYNALEYDAVALGNHEFDLGIEALVVNFMTGAKFDIVLTNADLSATPELGATIKPYVIRQYGRHKVGIVGVMTDHLAALSPLGSAVKLQPLKQSLQNTIAELADLGVNKIVVLSHQGYKHDLELARDVPQADIIIGADSESLLGTAKDLPGNYGHISGPYPTVVSDANGNRLVIQAFNWGRLLGQLDVQFNNQGQVVDWSGRPLHLAHDLPEDEGIKNLVKKLKQPLYRYQDTIVGQADMVIDGGRRIVRNAEAPMGNLVADSMLWATRDAKTQIAIQNGGGIRDSLSKGEISLGHLNTVLPFDNFLVVADVSGAAILATLEYGLSQVNLNDPAESGGSWPHISGIRIKANLKAPVGSRIETATVSGINGKPEKLDVDKTYRLVTNNYLISGGDGYNTLPPSAVKNRTDRSETLMNSLQEFIKSNSPISASIDGRMETRR